MNQAKVPEWVTKMHEHYWKFGYYRAEDLNRVLGDPRKGITIPTIGFEDDNSSI